MEVKDRVGRVVVIKGKSSVYEGSSPFKINLHSEGIYTLILKDEKWKGRFYLTRGYSYTLNFIHQSKAETLRFGKHKVVKSPGETSLNFISPKGRSVKVYRYRKIVAKGKIPMRVSVKPGKYTLVYEKSRLNLEVVEGYEYRVFFANGTEAETLRTKDYELIRIRGKTYLSILKPKGEIVKIYKGKRRIFLGRIPARDITIKAGKYMIKMHNKAFTVEIVRGYTHILYIKVRRDDRKVISEEGLNRLISAINRESFSDDKLQVLQTWAPRYYFLSSQAARIVPLFSFEDNRLKAIKILYPRLLDKENAEELIKYLQFSSSREEIREWIREYEEE